MNAADGLGENDIPPVARGKKAGRRRPSSWRRGDSEREEEWEIERESAVRKGEEKAEVRQDYATERKDIPLSFQILPS